MAAAPLLQQHHAAGQEVYMSLYSSRDRLHYGFKLILYFSSQILPIAENISSTTRHGQRSLMFMHSVSFSQKLLMAIDELVIYHGTGRKYESTKKLFRPRIFYISHCSM